MKKVYVLCFSQVTTSNNIQYIEIKIKWADFQGDDKYFNKVV